MISLSSKETVKGFLEQMKAILSSEDFDINRDFVFQYIRNKDEPDDEFSNENTLLELDYDTSDVIRVLKGLTLADYSESIVDNQSEGFHVFFVFGVKINERDIYIKIRLRERVNDTSRHVYCISFHFARYPIVSFPYR